MKNLRTASEFQNLADTVTRLGKDRKIYLVPSPGNWGDALINVGTYQFLDSINCRYEVCRRPDLLEKLSLLPEGEVLEALIIVGGGGGWCETWSSTRTFVHDIASKVGQVLILPTTYELPPIDEASNISYFTRDFKMSKEVVASAVFCHDMAFFLEVEVPPEEVTLPRVVALRVDKERSTEAVDFQFSIDVSLLGDAFCSILPLFQIINRYERVVSDRLHVAIAGCLLGKDVTLLPGLYPKSLSVYLSSMKENYLESRFVDWGDFKFWPVSELRRSDEVTSGEPKN